MSKVKIMRILFVLILWQISYTSNAATMQTGRASGSELLLLPKLCQIRFTYGHGSKEFSKWRKILGKDYLHVHHYCSGLAFLNRASKYDEHRNWYLKSAGGQLYYTIQHLENSDYVLLPDIYYQLGLVMKLKGKNSEAISYANKSIQSKKKYLKPYILLSDIYIESGNMDSAKEILVKAKAYHPNSKAIKRRLKKVKR